MSRLLTYIILPLFLVCIFLYPFSIGIVYTNSLLILTLIIAFLAVFIFVLASFYDPIKELRKQYIRPVYFFLVGYAIVFYQGYVDVLLGNLSELDFFFFYKSSLLNQAALLSTMGLLMFLFGYLSRNSKITLLKKKIRPIALKKILFFFTIINILSLYFNIEVMLMGEYSQSLIEEQAGSLGAYLQLIFYITYLSILVIQIINSRIQGVFSIVEFIRKLGGLFHVNIGLFLFLVMLSGDRGPILTYLLTYMFAIVSGTFYKFKFKYIIIAIFGGSLFFSILGIVRKMDTNLSFSERFIEVFSEGKVNQNYNSFSPATAELSTSVRTLHYSIAHVPDEYPHLYGINQLRESLKTIPFASSIFEPLFPKHFRYKNSAFYITWLDKGEFYTVGTGSSIIADLYLSFGEIGVILGMFLLGRVFRMFDLLVFSGSKEFVSIIGVVVAISLIGVSISWSRGTFLSPIQSIAFTYLFVLILLYKNSRLNRLS